MHKQRTFNILLYTLHTCVILYANIAWASQNKQIHQNISIIFVSNSHVRTSLGNDSDVELKEADQLKSLTLDIFKRYDVYYNIVYGQMSQLLFEKIIQSIKRLIQNILSQYIYVIE